MVKIYEKVEETKVVEKLVEVRCDLCKEVIPDSPAWGSGNNYEEVIVEAKYGMMYPESGSGEEISFDVCLRCFRERIVPIFAEVWPVTPRKIDY